MHAERPGSLELPTVSTIFLSEVPPDAAPLDAASDRHDGRVLCTSVVLLRSIQIDGRKQP